MSPGDFRDSGLAAVRPGSDRQGYSARDALDISCLDICAAAEMWVWEEGLGALRVTRPVFSLQLHMSQM